MLRQQEKPLAIYATEETRAALDWIDIVLNRFSGIDWRMIDLSRPDRLNRSPSRDWISLGGRIGFRAIELQKSVAFQFRDDVSGAIVVVAPAVGELTVELREAINSSGAVFIDGTFWNENELRAVRPGARSAREMNHLPINEGSLDFLRDSPVVRKIYTHINNTNPILTPGSRERTQVEDAGIEIACDGMEIIL